MASGAAPVATITPQSLSPVAPAPPQPNDWVDSTPDPGDWVDSTKQHKTFGDHLKDYWDKINPVTAAQGVWNAAQHPLDTLSAYGQQTDALRKKAVDSYNKGNYVEAAHHALSYLANGIPGVGSALDEAGNKFANGDIAGGLTDTAALATQIYGPEVVGRGVNAVKGLVSKAAANTVAPNLTPAQASAVDAATQAGVPMDAATATQNPAIQGTMALLKKQPMSARPLAKFGQAQQDALGNWAGDLSDQISPTATGGSASRVATGTNLVDQFKDAIDSTNAFQDTAYDRLRRISSANAQTVQVGSKASPLVGPNGAPITTPVMQTIEGPTDYTAAKAALQPLADSIEKTIPANQLQLSPGYNVLKQILSRPDTVDMDTAIQDLSSVQNIARGSGEIPQMRSRSQGIAGKATQVLRSAVDQAAQDMGPDAVTALQQGRELTQQKYALRDTLGNFRNEPAQSIDALVQPQDRSVAALNQVARQAPAMVPDIARATVQGILDKSATKPGSAWTQWQNIGPQTKEILFAHDPALATQLDNFFTAAKMIGDNPNPSGSATVGGLLATGAYVLHNPVSGAALLIGSKRLANLLTDPTTVARLSQGLQMPIGSAKAATSFKQLAALARKPSMLARAAATTTAIQSQQPNEPMPLSEPSPPASGTGERLADALRQHGLSADDVRSTDRKELSGIARQNGIESISTNDIARAAALLREQEQNQPSPLSPPQ